jgi:hypothetical protein
MGFLGSASKVVDAGLRRHDEGFEGRWVTTGDCAGLDRFLNMAK